jgi:copper chaperone NosL
VTAPGTRAALALAAQLLACAPGEGPELIAWDREPCAHCRMLISDPAFAAQLQTRDGVVASFDDPGCLLAALPAYAEVRALWFHHGAEERWLPGEGVGFVPVPRSPMGYGLAAVAAGAPGALSLEEARARVARAQARRSPP